MFVRRGSKKKNIEFEIRFLEGILHRSPRFVEALVALGDLYTKKGEYEKGLEIDERLAVLRGDDPYVLYNLACSYSLMNYVESALETIKKAVLCGYDDVEFMDADQDLANLQKDPRFRSYLSNLKERRTHSSNAQ